jgi:hypothetical protein
MYESLLRACGMCIEHVDNNVNNFVTLFVTFCWLLVVKKVLFSLA